MEIVINHLIVLIKAMVQIIHKIMDNKVMDNKVMDNKVMEKIMHNKIMDKMPIMVTKVECDY